MGFFLHFLLPFSCLRCCKKKRVGWSLLIGFFRDVAVKREVNEAISGVSFYEHCISTNGSTSAEAFAITVDVLTAVLSMYLLLPPPPPTSIDSADHWRAWEIGCIYKSCNLFCKPIYSLLLANARHSGWMKTTKKKLWKKPHQITKPQRKN